MSLYQLPLLFPGMFVTLRGGETPVLRQATFKGNLGVGEPGQGVAVLGPPLLHT